MSHTKVKAYTDKQLLERIKKLPSFKGFPDGYFIIGVRSNEDSFDTYDDKFYIYFNDHHMTDRIDGIRFCEVLTGTTNPGGKILKGGFLRFNKKGAAILRSDWCHYDMWYATYRDSRGWELRQGKPTWIYRDGDMDEKSEELGDPILQNAGINWHTNTFKWYNSVVNWFIGSWSAGCQVTNVRDKFVSWVKVFNRRRQSGAQKYITYFLIKEF